MRVNIVRKLKERMIARRPGLSARLIGEYPLVQVVDHAATAAPLECAIPSVLFQTWETNAIGQTHFKALDAFRKRNPELDFVFFDGRQMDAYMAEFYGDHPIYPIYTRGKFGPLRTDIWRYCILLERGGFYMDINKELMRPIRDFVRPETTALFAYESTLSLMVAPNEIASRLVNPHNLVVNWGFGFAKGHPILQKTIDNICKYYPQFAGRIFEQPKHAIIKLTGPAMLTQSLYDTLLQNPSPAFDAGLVQAGIDFDGSGNSNMARSWVRYAQIPAYAQARHQIIVD